MLCLACYQDRLASVLENAVEFRLYGRDGDHLYPAGCLTLPSKDPTDRTSAMAARGVTHLVCGALSKTTGASLEAAGISCTAWVRGSVGEVLEGVRANQLHKMAMPGCRVTVAAAGGAGVHGGGRSKAKSGGGSSTPGR